MPNETATGVKASPKRRALLVGINDYPGFGQDLPSCVDDARSMTELLSKSYGFDCTVLVDAEATQAAVAGGVKALCEGIAADDRVVFYYSGHGASVPRADLIEECLVLADGTLLSDDAFVAAFKDAPPGTSLVVLDSCFSGGMSKTPFAMPKTLQIMQPTAESALRKGARYKPFGGRARPNFAGFTAARKQALINSDETNQESLNALLVSACLEGETALASTFQSNGLSAFTYAILSTLAARGESITVADLVVGATEELRRIGAIQTPQIKEPPTPAMLSDAAFPLLTAIAKSAKGVGPLVSESRAKLMSKPNFEVTPSVAMSNPAVVTAILSLLSGVDWNRARAARAPNA